MGSEKRRKKNMVDPSWDSFASPNQNNQSNAPALQENNEKQPEQSNAKEGDWGNFQSPITYQGKVDPTADEGMFNYLLRGATRLASRGVEQTLGGPGNTEKFVKDVVSKVPATTGVLGWAISELMGPENWQRFIKGPPGEEQQLPTSSKLKEQSQNITGGYTTPKTKGERELDELTEDVASTFNPLTRLNPATRWIPAGRLRAAANHFLIPAAANAGKKVVGDLGFGEDAANLTKFSIWLPLSLANNINGARYASDLMNRGRNGFNQNLAANVPAYQNQLNGVARNMLHGDPRSALAQQQIAGITDDLANGRTTMRDLMTRYDAINAAKRDRGLFALNAGDRAGAIRNINQVRDVVRNQIETLGAANPQALRDWQNGVQAWATIHRSNSITNWIQNVAQGRYAKILTGPAAALFGAGSYGAATHPIVTGTGGAAAAGGYKTGQILYRMWNDPNLRTYYWNAINAAMGNNLPSFLSNYDKLNKKLDKSEPVEPNGHGNK